MTSRAWINFWLDLLLLVVFATLLIVAAVVRFVFPTPLDSAGWVLWGYTYDDWANFQFALVATLALGVLLHVMLHWTWVCGLIATRLRGNRKGLKNDSGIQTLYGVGLLIVVLTVVGVTVAAAQLTVRRPSYTTGFIPPADRTGTIRREVPRQGGITASPRGPSR